MSAVVGPNRLQPLQAVQTAERLHHGLVHSRALGQPVVIAGPAVMIIVPLVFGNDGVVIESGLHLPTPVGVETQHVVQATDMLPDVSPGDSVEVGTAALVVFVLIGREAWMWLRGIDPSTGTWH